MSRLIKNRMTRTAAALALILTSAAPTWPATAPDGSAAVADNAPDVSQPASATPPTKAPAASTAAPTPPAEVANEIEQLRSSVEAQARKFEEDSKELAAERASLQVALDRIAALESKLGVTAEAKPATTSSSSSGVEPLADSLTPTLQDRQNKQPINIVGTENPLSIKIGGATFTPGGFVDLTGIFRSRDVGSGLGTNFTILPYANSLPLGQLSEFRFTGQGSRLSLKVDAQPSESTGVTGYFESDFNGFEPANSNISTKSDSFRLRLAFVQIRHGKWELVTGQTWSFLTPTRDGLSPYPESVFTALAVGHELPRWLGL